MDQTQLHLPDAKQAVQDLDGTRQAAANSRDRTVQAEVWPGGLRREDGQVPHLDGTGSEHALEVRRNRKQELGGHRTQLLSKSLFTPDPCQVRVPAATTDKSQHQACEADGERSVDSIIAVALAGKSEGKTRADREQEPGSDSRSDSTNQLLRQQFAARLAAHVHTERATIKNE
ncbi:Hypothetical_protein [Hexamita inflata]|uniref:Hypothetical_protein n=1 Tax=Hexamita inflata TaxID=28002 RepID=A0AA86NEJ4_9EUKA|nr:Hypothetical protein HINF_LOCUS5533 [Hexamita inflata]CAI9945195.1 Hypothetical protein HINF_LOCUS32840 [Hexamita inflata]